MMRNYDTKVLYDFFGDSDWKWEDLYGRAFKIQKKNVGWIQDDGETDFTIHILKVTKWPLHE
jgi:hypothetical protein